LKLVIEADGGSRGNPGPAGSGAIILNAENGAVLREIAEDVGIATNNVAEYKALIFALEAANQLDPDAEIQVRMDSKLVVEQMSGKWKIKHPDMRDLAVRANSLIRGRVVEFVWIPREQNSRADRLANLAMDGMPSPSSSIMEFNQSDPSSIRAPKVQDPGPTTFTLVRHGRTTLTESGKISGGDGEDPSLSDLGQKDAEQVATEIANFGVSGNFSFLKKPSRVIHSPVKRAAETADMIAQRIGVPTWELETLREIGFGDWDGLTQEEVLSGFEAEYSAWRGSFETAPPGGESLREFDSRIQETLDRILQEHVGEHLVVVAHVMPIRAILRTVTESSLVGFWRPNIAPASISIARFWGRSGAELVCVNSTAHLSS
jgi:ribonuclease H / adenosylcobalamin/alpha-ribazole phosphatase